MYTLHNNIVHLFQVTFDSSYEYMPLSDIDARFVSTSHQVAGGIVAVPVVVH